MILKKLTLNNFKKFKEKEIEIHNRTIISGKNREGKSTIYSAWLWLFTDTNEDVRPTFSSNNTITSVEAEIVYEENSFTIKKECLLKFVNKRGSLEPVLEGINYNYYINNTSVKKEDFIKIDNLDIEQIRILSNLFFFNGLHWKKQRKHIMDLVDFYGSEENELKLTEIKKNISSIKKQYDNLNSRLSELTRSKKEINLDIDTIEKEQTELQESYACVQSTIASSKISSQDITIWKKDLEELGRKYREIKSKLDGKCPTCKTPWQVKDKDNLIKLAKDYITDGNSIKAKIDNFKPIQVPIGLTEAEHKCKVILGKMQENSTKIAEIKNQEKLLVRIKELDSEIIESSKKYSELLQQQEKLEAEIIQTNINMQLKLNSIIPDVKFEVIKTHYNGNREECFKMKVNGIEYDKINTGDKPKVMIKLINEFRKKWKNNLPLFIDNCESSNNIFRLAPYNSICLIVTESEMEILENKEFVR